MKENIYPAINEKAYTHVLGNGLKICVIPKKGFNRAFAMFAVKYGSVDARFESSGSVMIPPKGVAHFLEHKVFEQPDGGNALQVFAQTGASPNAFTSRCMTAYHFSCTEHFKRNLEILLDFVSSPYFTDENVKKEQGIIGREINMVNDNPYHCVMDGLFENLYVNHPARDSIIGTHESIGNITRDVLMSCYSTFYVPSNMTLTVVGDIDAQEVCDIAQAMLRREYVKAPVRDYGEEPECVATQYSEKHMEVNLPVFAAGFKTSVTTDGEEGVRNRMVAELAAEVLAGESSPLYTELYEKGLINKQFGAGAMFFPGSVCMLATGESAQPQNVCNALCDAAEKMVSEPEPECFARIRRAYCGMQLRALDRFELLCREQTQALMSGYDYLSAIADVEGISWAEVRQMLENTVCGRRMAVSAVLPK